MFVGLLSNGVMCCVGFKVDIWRFKYPPVVRSTEVDGRALAVVADIIAGNPPIIWEEVI